VEGEIEEEKSEQPISRDSSSTISAVDKIDQDAKSENEGGEKLSKRQLKRQKKRELWESARVERRKEEKQRRQKRKQEQQQPNSGEPSRKRPKLSKLADESWNSKISVAIDMSFDDLMSDKDLKRTLTQIQYCYSANRRSSNPLKLYVTNFRGKSRPIFDQIQGATNWHEKCIQLKDEHFSDCFPDGKQKLVYLSSESPNVLTKLDDDKIYIIGGLVDHNAHKGLCLRLAQEKEIEHARLPIDEYVVMKTRKVLTINHVFEIMLRFTELGDWEKAFFRRVT